MNEEVKFAVRRFVDGMSAVRWGSPSYETWKRNCEFSLRSSQRRRKQTKASKFWGYTKFSIGVAFLIGFWGGLIYVAYQNV